MFSNTKHATSLSLSLSLLYIYNIYIYIYIFVGKLLWEIGGKITHIHTQNCRHTKERENVKFDNHNHRDITVFQYVCTQTFLYAEGKELEFLCLILVVGSELNIPSTRQDNRACTLLHI